MRQSVSGFFWAFGGVGATLLLWLSVGSRRVLEKADWALWTDVLDTPRGIIDSPLRVHSIFARTEAPL